MAALAPAQKSSTHGGATGEVPARWVNSGPVVPQARLDRHLVPIAPS